MGERSPENQGNALDETCFSDLDVAKFHEGILQDAKIWLMYLNAGHEIITWNRGAQEISGYSCEEVVGSHAVWKKIYPEEKYRKEVTRKIEDVIKEKKALENVETIITTKSGEKRRILWNTRQVEDEDGAVLGFLSLGIDITEKSELETKYQLVIENAPMAIVLIRGGRLIFANDATAHLTGFTVEEMTGHILTDFIYPQDRARVMKYYQDRMAGKDAPKTYDFRVMTAGGEVRQAEVTIAQYRHNGDIITIDFINDITDRSVAEERLKEREEVFHAIASAALDAIIMSDDEDLITYWNPAAERIFGYRADEVIGKRLHNLIPHPKHRQPDHHDLKHFHETGESPVIGTIHELTMLRKGGVEFPGELSVAKAQLKGRWHAIGIVRDITERKEKELELQKLAAIVRHSSEMVTLITLDGTIVFQNEAGARMLDTTPGQMLGKNLKEFLPEEMRQKVDAEVIPSLIKTEYWEGDLQYIAPSGRRIDTHAINFTITDPITEEVRFMANVSLDITDQKMAEKQRSLLSAIVQNSQDAIIGLDLKGRIISWNEGARRIYGYEAAEIIGKEVSMLIPPDRIGELENEIEQYTTGKVTPTFETIRITKFGERIDVAVTASPIRDEKGEVTGASAIVRDITKEKKMSRTMLGYITEAAMRLKNPVEIIRDNLAQTLDSLEKGEIDVEDARMQITIQIKNAEQILFNLRELDQAIVGTFEDLPDKYRKFLTR